jgi:hypothetical protein
MHFKHLLILVAIATITACSSRKKIVEGSDISIEDTELVEQINVTNEAPAFFSARGKGRFSGAGINQGFKIDVRSTRDSIIWIDISAAIMGIKVARLVATPDSVLFYNRLDKTYMRSSISELNKLVRGPVDFKDLQALINGEPIAVMEKKSKLEKREGLWHHEVNGVERVLSLRFDASTFLLVAQSVDYPIEKQRIDANYRKNGGRGSVPEEIVLSTIYKGDSIELQLNFDQIDTERQPSYPFEIPRGYKAM